VPVALRIEEALAAGHDFLAITDHRNVDHLFDPDWHSDELLLVSGNEWGGPGHGNTFGLRTDNTPDDFNDWDQALASWSRARLQGAVQAVNHYGLDEEYWDAFFTERPEVKLTIDAFEVWNAWWRAYTPMNKRSIARWEDLLDEGLQIAAVGGSDSHFSAFPLGFPVTIVYASNLSQMAILEGIRRGRTYIANPYPYTMAGAGENPTVDPMFTDIGPTPTLVFEADGDGDGVFEAMLGDTLPVGALSFHLVVQNAQGPVEVIRGREVLTSFPADAPGGTVDVTFSDTPTGPTRYRIEMRSGAKANDELLLFSSPIYVK
jgi:hypothetical protein